MKGLFILFAVTIAGAEPPRFRAARFRSQRQELAPSTTDSAAEPTTTAYPPSGWKPTGQPFTLPIETEAPANTYGPPDSGPYPYSGWKPAGEPFTLPNEPPTNTYGTPDNSYGVPTTDNPKAEKLEGPVEVQKSVGTYFVVLPNGQLQEVKFATENDVQNMKYTARLQLGSPAPLFIVRT